MLDALYRKLRGRSATDDAAEAGFPTEEPATSGRAVPIPYRRKPITWLGDHPRPIYWSSLRTARGTVTVADRLMDRQGMLAGHACIGRTAIGFLEFDTTGTKDGRTYAVFGADDDGLSVAHTFREGSLVPGCPVPTSRDVLDCLLEIAAEPRPGKPAVVDAIDRALNLESGVSTRLEDIGRMAIREGTLEDYDEVQKVTKAVVDVLRDRLGPTRMRSFHASFGMTTPENMVATGERKVSAQADALSLDASAVAALERFVASRPWLRNMAAASPALDYGGSTGEAERALALANGLHPAAMRRFGPGIGCVTPEMVGLISSVPIDWVPGRNDSEEWMALRAMARTSWVIPSDANLRTLLAGVGGRWVRFLRGLACDCGIDGDAMLAGCRLELDAEATGGVSHEGRPYARKGGSTLAESLRDSLRDTNDVIADLAQFLDRLPHAPAIAKLASRSSRIVATEAIVGTRRLSSLLALTREWHDDPAFMDGPISRAPVDWDPLLPEWTDAVSGIGVVPLANSHALGFEGWKGIDPDGMRGLGHCVGQEDYVVRCAGDEIRIVSLRKAGRRLSTAEIALGNATKGGAGTSTGHVVQHRGCQNVQPGPAERSALEAYMALPSVRDAFTRAVPRKVIPKSPELVEPPQVTIGKWRPYLTGKWKTASVGDLSKALDEAIAREEARLAAEFPSGIQAEGAEDLENQGIDGRLAP